MYGSRIYGVVGCLRLTVPYVFPFLAAAISTWLDHPGSAADITELEELPGTWLAGPMVSIRKKLYTSSIPSEVTEARKMAYLSDTSVFTVYLLSSLTHLQIKGSITPWHNTLLYFSLLLIPL